MHIIAAEVEPLSITAVVSMVIFLMVVGTISFRLLHESAAALLGAVFVFLVTYIGGYFNPNLQILNFDQAMVFVDWNVIFLILGMMIFMAILSSTNIFRWIGLRIYRYARGNTWLIALLLITFTGLSSAFLNNVTSVLLIVPISIQLAIAIGLNPIGLVIAEILASNIGGSATLIGDPPSTIVGSHIGISFVEYLVLIAPVAVVCMLVLILIHRLQFRNLYTSKGKPISPVLLNELTKEAQIENHKTLYKALIVGSVTLILFFVADLFNSMPPSVVALSGAAVLLAWERPDVDDMVKEVDWTTLIFFIGLFIVVAGMEASGTIDWLANQLLILAHGSLTSATILTTWVSGIASGFVDNIPFTVAALPIVDLMTVNIPNPAENYILYWALVLGADFGGNLTYLGSASNIIAIGLLAQAGYRISFGQFMRNSVPTTIATLIIAVIYLLLRFM